MPQRAFPRRGCGDAGKRICRRVGPFARARRTLPSACRPPGTRASLRAIFARARRTLPSACRPFGPRAFLHAIFARAPDAPSACRPSSPRASLRAIFARARRTLPSACRPFGPRAFLHAIFARARRTLPSACRPPGPRAFLHAIFARAPDAPICLPSARPARLPARNFCPCAGRSICLPPVQPARLPARNFRPCAPDAPICLPPVRPARLPARNFCPCAPDAPICLPSARPARLPARNFRPCAGRSHLLAVRPARAPPCTQFSPVRRTHFAPARFEPHGNGGAPARLPARNFRPCAGRISRPPGSSRTETAAPPRAGRSAGRKTRGMAEGLEARLKRLHTPLEN